MEAMAGRRILITGASVAGNTLAWWLARQGAAVTVVERAPRFRDGGQNVEVRGAARAVLRIMGLEDRAFGLVTGEKGVRFVDESGEGPLFRVDDTASKTFTQELEILRGDLAKLLLDQADGPATYRFGDSIATIEDGPDDALVRFESGDSGRYDLIVVAEGVGSSTRAKIFPGENNPRWLDMINAYATIPRGDGDGEIARWFTATHGRGLILRPDRHGGTRALFIVKGQVSHTTNMNVGEQKAFLAERFADLGWECPRALAGMATSETFYFDTLRQVRMARWSSGRVTLCGDAAWCATPVSGVGATLAVMGAYVLAGELLRSPVIEAVAAYERFMRPAVEKAQGFPAMVLSLGNPQTRWGVGFKSAALTITASPLVRRGFARLVASKSDKVELPRYDLRTQ